MHLEIKSARYIEDEYRENKSGERERERERERDYKPIIRDEF